jgi:hypothetical protein
MLYLNPFSMQKKINNNGVLLTQIELAVVEYVLLLLNGVLEGGDVLGELCLLLVQHLHFAHQHRLLMRQLPDKCKVNDLSSIEEGRAAERQVKVLIKNLDIFLLFPSKEFLSISLKIQLLVILCNI